MERQWFIATRAGVLGPMDGAGVVARVRSGDARPDTQVCTTDDHQWIEMRRVPELARDMAQQDAMAWAEPHVPAPPPAPGEPWFFNVPIGVAAALQCLSFGFYAGVWEQRHLSWLKRRRARPQMSDCHGFETLLPHELASAHARLGLSDPRRLPPANAIPFAVVYFLWFLWPVEVALELRFLIGAQAAAATVNREVAPGAAAPLMGLGEWMAVLAGLAVWSFVAIALLLLFAHFRTL